MQRAHPVLHNLPEIPAVSPRRFHPGEDFPGQTSIDVGNRRRKASIGAMSIKKGVLWGDASTKPIKKNPLPSIRRKSNDEGENKECVLTEGQEAELRKDAIKALQELKDRDMKGILPSLKNIDKSREGRLWVDQVKIVLQTHKIALNEKSSRNLFRKFGEMDKLQHFVRYEELVNYLTRLFAEASALPTRKPPTPPAAGLSNRPDRVSVENIGGGVSHYNSNYQYYNYPPSYQATAATQQRISNMRNKVMFQDRDEAKLILDLERELQDQPVNMTDLRNLMYYFDRDRNNFLNSNQVQEALQRCNIYLSPELFSRLLLATDRTGAGLYQIETIMNYLTRVRPETHGYHANLGMNYNPRRIRAPILPALLNQPLFHVPYSAQGMEMDFYSDYDEYSSPYESGEAKADDEFNVSKWSSDFQNLVQALHQADPSRTGYLTEAEASRISNNYCLVYNLGISETTIKASLQKAYDSQFQKIGIDHFASCLEEMHLQEMLHSLP